MCPLLDTYLKVNICHHLTGFNALDLNQILIKMEEEDTCHHVGLK